MRMLAVAVVVGCALAVACASSDEACPDTPLDPDAAEALEDAAGAVDFELTRPCSTRSGMAVTAVVVDAPAGSPRVTFVLGDGGGRMMLSQSRAVSPFRQIPRGTRRLAWDVDGVSASGFEGTSFSGSGLLYLQWEVDGVVFELQATPGKRFSAEDARETARANIRRSAAQDEVTPEGDAVP